MADASTKQHRHRGRWVTAAAVILIVYGGLGIVYAPFLVGGVVWMFLGVGISTLTILAVLNIATGVGLLRLHVWARVAAGLLAAVSLVFMHAPALARAVATGVWTGIDWLGRAGNIVVVFAVLRRWPAEPVGVD